MISAPLPKASTWGIGGNRKATKLYDNTRGGCWAGCPVFACTTGQGVPPVRRRMVPTVRRGTLRLSPSASPPHRAKSGRAGGPGSLGASAKQGKLSRKAREEGHPPGLVRSTRIKIKVNVKDSGQECPLDMCRRENARDSCESRALWFASLGPQRPTLRLSLRAGFLEKREKWGTHCLVVPAEGRAALLLGFDAASGCRAAPR